MSNIALPKIIHKITPVIGNSLYQLLPGLINQVLAFFVIKQSGAITWGQVVSLQLVYYIAAHIVSWGNKDYLLLQFSKNPAGINRFIQQSVLTRLFVLLLPVVILVLLYYPINIGLYLAGWIIFRFAAQSLEAIITYQKNFTLALRSEAAAFVILLIALTFAGNNISFQQVLGLVLLSHVARVLLLTSEYKTRLKGIKISGFHITSLWGAIPFLLMGLVALLQSKIDLYVMDNISTKTLTGSYQVLMSFGAMLIAIPGFIINPFVKNIYRMQQAQVNNLHIKFASLGFIISIAAIPILYIIMQYVYQLNFSIYAYVLLFFIIWMPFIYAINIYKLYKQNLQNKVLVINAIAIGCSFFACLILIPLQQIIGALIAQLIAQLFLVIALHQSAKKLMPQT